MDEQVISYQIYRFLTNTSNVCNRPNLDVLTNNAFYCIKNVVDGSLSAESYYATATYDENTAAWSYSNKVAEITHNYFYIDGFHHKRISSLVWVLSNGDNSSADIIVKVYNGAEKIEAKESHRKHIIAELKIKVLEFVVYTNNITVPAAEDICMPFLSGLIDCINQYIHGFKTPLMTAVTNETGYPFLDNLISEKTIREFILEYLARG